ncbi:MAG: DUF5750 family protein [Methanobacterium sp.]
MKVKIAGYGQSEDSNKYFVTYRIFDINEEIRKKLETRLKDDLIIKSNDLFLTVYFDPKYFPFGSEEYKYRREDFIAREEIEMLAYLLGVLEE